MKENKSFLENFLFKKEANGEKKLKTHVFFIVAIIPLLLFMFYKIFTFSFEEEAPTLSEISLSDAQSESKRVDSDAQEEKAQKILENISEREMSTPLSRLFEKTGSTLSGEPRSMVIERKEGIEDHHTTLPRGTLLLAMLLNTIVSNNTNSPVVAKVTLDHFHLGSLFIPKDSKLIGQATQDNNPKRVMVTFDTIVFPDKRQLSFRATGLNPDGSSGLTGQYYSGKGREIFGSLLSAAIAGAAEGSQTTSTTPYGTEVKRGSVQNAIYGGISGAAVDQAKRFAKNIEQAKSYVVVPQEAQILVFFDQSLNMAEVAYEY